MRTCRDMKNYACLFIKMILDYSFIVPASNEPELALGSNNNIHCVMCVGINAVISQCMHSMNGFLGQNTAECYRLYSLSAATTARQHE